MTLSTGSPLPERWSQVLDELGQALQREYTATSERERSAAELVPMIEAADTAPTTTDPTNWRRQSEVLQKAEGLTAEAETICTAHAKEMSRWMEALDKVKPNLVKWCERRIR